MVLLVHGIVDARNIPSQGAIVHGNLAAICSPIIDDVTSLFADPDRVAALAVQHNETLCEWTARTDVLPLRIGTLCGDESGVAELLAREEERFTLGLAHVRDAVELGVRVTLDEAAQGKPAEAETKPAVSGRDFLKKRAEAVTAKRNGAGQADALINDLVAKLHATARDMRQLPTPANADKTAPKRVFNGAFLVARDQVDAFHQLADEMGGALDEKGLTLALNGPWPAYNFLPEAV